MRLKLHRGALPLVLLLAGCVTNTDIGSMNPAELDQLARLEVLTAPTDRPNESLGVVKGLSCQRTIHQPTPSEAEAIQRLRANAVKMGADAVVSATCQYKTNIDWAQNCVTSYMCVGNAVRWQ